MLKVAYIRARDSAPANRNINLVSSPIYMSAFEGDTSLLSLSYNYSMALKLSDDLPETRQARKRVEEVYSFLQGGELNF